MTQLPSAVCFSGQSLSIIDRDGVPHLTAADLARALGYKDTSAVLRIYSRHTDEFTYQMTLVVNLTVKGFGSGNSEKPVRLFSPRGCHMVAMFARTSVAAAFRRWVLDVLEFMPSIRKTGEYTVNPDLEYDQMRSYSKDRKQMEALNTAHSRWISDVRRLLESAGIKEPEFPKGLEDSEAIATSALVELLRWHRWVLDFDHDFRLRLTPVTLHTNVLTSDEVADWVRHPTFPSKHLPDIAKAAIERMSKAFSEKSIGPHMEQAAKKVRGVTYRRFS
ncbi:Bro-N domain-containing protein [Xylella fastidiosa]|uniref:Bro-N domain-containing protein n=1 Tax=Xylella fastidiosa TaxID=2371 RepID=A0ABD7BY75_XYLFS|nr:Bro-N domain-containing protein [Xylella fastidiosa]